MISEHAWEHLALDRLGELGWEPKNGDLEPRVEGGDDRVGQGMVAVGDADDLAAGLLVGLGAAQVQQ